MAVAASREAELALERVIEYCDTPGVRSSGPEFIAEALEMATEAMRLAYPDGGHRVKRVRGIAASHVALRHDLPYIIEGCVTPAGWLAFHELWLQDLLLLTTTLKNALQEVRDARTVASSGLPFEPHPVIASAAADMWRDGYWGDAVQAAARAVETQLRSRMGWDGCGTGSALVREAFGEKPPKPGGRRLRFNNHPPGSDASKDANQGALNFGLGCFMRLRNLPVHGADLDPDEALLALAAFSLLARWVEEAEAEDGPRA